MRLHIVLSAILFTSFHVQGQLIEQDEMRIIDDAYTQQTIVPAADPATALLRSMPSVLLNAQGGPGGQADLSIRGSSFSGAGLSLEGLSIGCAQTEHFNAEMPFPSGIFYAPTVLTGFQQTRQTEGHLVGTVDFNIRPFQSGLSLSIGAGEYNSLWGYGLAESSIPLAHDAQLGWTLFGGNDHFYHLNYDDNDSKRWMGGGAVQYITSEDITLNLLSGYQEKEFGARGYYGTNPDYAADESISDWLSLASIAKKLPNGTTWHGAAAYRILTDDYTLCLPTSLYKNAHETHEKSATVGAQNAFLQHGRLNWRISGIEESISSDSLGNHHRSRATGTLIPEWRWKHLSLSAGLQQLVFSREQPATLPQAACILHMTDAQQVELSYSQSVRQPSYTELNYDSPSSLGNTGLDNQLNETLDLTWRLQTASDLAIACSIFHLQTHDTVDWIRQTAESTRWTASNIGTVTTLGSELIADWTVTPTLQLQGGLTLLKKDNQTSLYSSRYALDYARCLTKLTLNWQLTDALLFTATGSYRKQADNPLRTGSQHQFLADTTLRIDLTENLYINLSINNLWNDTFEPFPGQQTATGRRYYASLTAAF